MLAALTGASGERPMHNDEPTLRDRLRRNALIAEVGEAIATCKPPQVFGVHDDWGLGKTSFLHQVRWYLTGDNPQALDTINAPKKSKHGDRLLSVWFDAWRYHAEAVPVVALLQEMRAQLSQEDSKALALKRLGKVALRGALLSLDELTKKIGFHYAKFEQAGRRWDAENLAATLPSESLRKNLQETIRLLLPAEKRGSEGKSRLVVFVDDLDRCESESAYRLLEGLKVYLTLDNCVFVLGLNQRAVEGAIANRLAGGLTDEDARRDAQARAASYLEKICQNVWHLPIPDAPGHAVVRTRCGWRRCCQVPNWLAARRRRAAPVPAAESAQAQGAGQSGGSSVCAPAQPHRRGPGQLGARGDAQPADGRVRPSVPS